MMISIDIYFPKLFKKRHLANIYLVALLWILKLLSTLFFLYKLYRKNRIPYKSLYEKFAKCLDLNFKTTSVFYVLASYNFVRTLLLNLFELEKKVSKEKRAKTRGDWRRRWLWWSAKWSNRNELESKKEGRRKVSSNHRQGGFNFQKKLEARASRRLEGRQHSASLAND